MVNARIEMLPFALRNAILLFSAEVAVGEAPAPSRRKVSAAAEAKHLDTHGTRSYRPKASTDGVERERRTKLRAREGGRYGR
jgi:hypothetical protein